MSVNLNIRIVGAKQLAAAVQRAGDRLPNEIGRNMRRAAEIVVGSAKRQFKGSRTRSFYSITGGSRKRRRNPRAVTSPPGVLGIFEGRYRQAISASVSRRGRKRWSAEIGPVGVDYARRHEFGIGTPKRPVLGPAIEATEERVFELIGTAFRVLR